jgi:phosphatidylglycerophosphate synthase
MRNIPNILSIIRICFVPAFVVIYFANEGSMKIYAALIYWWRP